MRLIKHLLIFGFLFGSDFILKYWACHYVSSPIPVFETPFGIDFYVDCITNRGGAWGMLSSYYTPLLLFRIGIIAFLLFQFLFRKSSFFLLCILTGALGNVVDCLLYGHVIDMLHFTFWGHSYGIFNLADSLIFLGAMGLILTMKKKQKDKDASKSRF